MILTLEVVGPQAANLGHAARKTFTSAGGTIGRSNDNDWIIPDSYVSGTHARIHFRNNRFFVVDSSANGTSLKSRANRLTRGQWYALSDMDRLFLDTVEIRIRVENPAEKVTAPIAVEPGVTLVPDTKHLPASPAPTSAALTSVLSAATNETEHVGSHTTPLMMPTDAVLSVLMGDRDLSSFDTEYLNSPLADEEFLTKALEQSPAATPPSAAPLFEHTTSMLPDRRPASYDEQAPARTVALNLGPKSAEIGSAVTIAIPRPSEHSASGTAQHQKITVDAEYADIFGAAPVAPSVAPAAQQPAAITPPAASINPPVTPAASNAAMLDTQRVKSLLLSGMNIPADNMTPELNDTLTQILRECLHGLLELQQQREYMKDAFRLSVTKFKAAENNPLRFSANVEDALYNLLVKRNPAYLAPADAVTSSFRDAQWHQMAMQHAINTAFFSTMQQLDPRRFDGSGKPKGFFARLFSRGENAGWQKYNKHYAELRKQQDGGFNTLFGSAFAHAYQEELDRLRRQS